MRWQATMPAIAQDTATASATETSTTPPVWHAIAASASMIPTFGTTATDGTTPGTIPGTAGMDPTIATAMQAGTTGAGAGITMDGTIPGTTADTTEAIIMAIMAGIEAANRPPQAATSDSAQQPIQADQAAAGQVADL